LFDDPLPIPPVAPRGPSVHVGAELRGPRVWRVQPVANVTGLRIFNPRLQATNLGVVSIAARIQ
jgi:hypothetical protein